MAAMMVEKPKSEHFDLAPMFEQTNCLNEDSNNAHGNIFNEGVESYLESDADEQILLRINFKSAVKIAELQLGCPEGETVPTSVKLFINTPDLGFDEAEDLTPTQHIEFTDTTQTDGEGEAIKLNFVKFQYVSNLTVFVPENQGGDTTQISSLKLFGSPVIQMNMAEFKKQG